MFQYTRDLSAQTARQIRYKDQISKEYRRPILPLFYPHKEIQKLLTPLEKLHKIKAIMSNTYQPASHLRTPRDRYSINAITVDMFNRSVKQEDIQHIGRSRDSYEEISQKDLVMEYFRHRPLVHNLAHKNDNYQMFISKEERQSKTFTTNQITNKLIDVPKKQKIVKSPDVKRVQKKKKLQIVHKKKQDEMKSCISMPETIRQFQYEFKYKTPKYIDVQLKIGPKLLMNNTFQKTQQKSHRKNPRNRIDCKPMQFPEQIIQLKPWDNEEFQL